MSKVTAIISGGCHDCSCDHLVLPEGLDLEAVRQEWNTWYRTKYVGSRIPYRSYIDFLYEAGARKPNADELTVIED